MLLSQLELLIALDTYRNLDTAAEACFISRHTLRRQLLRMEKELGHTLYTRSSNSMLMPTALGVLVTEQARVVLHELSRIHDIVKDEEQEPRGELRVGIIPTLAQYLMPFFLSTYAKQYPQVHLYIEEFLTDEIISKLRSGVLDVGLVATPLKVEGILERPMFYERMMLYVSSDHPFFDRDKVKLNEINTEDLWLLQEGNTFRNQVLMLLDKRPAVDDTMREPYERSNIENLKQTIENQYGITVLPELATLSLTADQRKHLKRIVAPKPCREISLITHQSCLKFRLVETLFRQIVESIPEKMRNTGRGVVVPVRF